MVKICRRIHELCVIFHPDKQTYNQTPKQTHKLSNEHICQNTNIAK